MTEILKIRNSEAASLSGLKSSTLTNWVSRGKIHFLENSGGWREFQRNDVLKLSLFPILLSWNIPVHEASKLSHEIFEYGFPEEPLNEANQSFFARTKWAGKWALIGRNKKNQLRFLQLQIQDFSTVDGIRIDELIAELDITSFLIVDVQTVFTEAEKRLKDAFKE